MPITPLLPPLAAHRDPVPFVDLDGIAAADGLWQALNWDLLPDALWGERVDRSEVIEVTVAGKITGKVRIEEETRFVLGQGIVKLADKNSEQELYAVLINKHVQIVEPQPEEADDSAPALVEQDIKPYFKFLTSAEFEAGKTAAQEQD